MKSMPPDELTSYSFTVGRLLCGKVRDYLKRRRFEGDQVEWLEGSGLLSREFTIKGPPDLIMDIKRELFQWKRENNL